MTKLESLRPSFWSYCSNNNSYETFTWLALQVKKLFWTQRLIERLRKKSTFFFSLSFFLSHSGSQKATMAEKSGKKVDKREGLGKIFTTCKSSSFVQKNSCNLWAAPFFALSFFLPPKCSFDPRFRRWNPVDKLWSKIRRFDSRCCNFSVLRVSLKKQVEKIINDSAAMFRFDAVTVVILSGLISSL